MLQTAFMCLLAFAAGTHADLLITKANREINLATQTVTIKETLVLKNLGPEAANEVILCDRRAQAAQCAFREVVLGTEDDAPELEVQERDAGALGGNLTCYAAVLDRLLTAGSSVTLETYAAYTKQQVPHPAEVAQGEAQRVVYTGDHYLLSPYKVALQTTKVKFPNRNIESHTSVGPTSKSGSMVTYGPYPGVAPFTASPMRLHFENNTPFAEVTRLVREVEVSHWGNLYVEEAYVVRHGGARLTGEWSRINYQADAARYGAASFKELVAVLPRSAHTLYFRDEIGNVSTSFVRHMRDKLEARLLPRFPLFGGWSSEFTFGYSLPLKGFVKKLPGGVAKLVIPFSTPLQNVVVDDLTVKVVVPEGATNMKASLSFPATITHDKKFTYLDMAGRPVLTLHKRNVVADHNVPLTVTYSLPGLHLLQEPLLLVSGFGVLFATVIVYSRCEFSL